MDEAKLLSEAMDVGLVQPVHEPGICLQEELQGLYKKNAPQI
jgi:hypothetical protein